MNAVSKLFEFKDLLKKKDKLYLLVHKTGSTISDCAFHSLKEVTTNNKMDNILYVDAVNYPEIHKHYGVTSAPTLLVFEKGQLKDLIKGCHDSQFYKQIFENTVFYQKAQKSTQQKNVTVYSTPSCPWCNTLKNFLRKNGIYFTDIDVSRDQEAARQMISATGQQGVPQANIGGEWVVGFDQKRIKQLLNI